MEARADSAYGQLASTYSGGTSATDFIDELMQQQAPPTAGIDEAFARLPRYVFNPFKEKRLKPLDQGEWGLTKLRAGVIQPIFEFPREESNFAVVKDIEEGDLTVSFGLTEMRKRRKPPYFVVEAMKKRFGEKLNIPTGFRELESLRGIDRSQLETVRQIQILALPVVYRTHREMQEQLEGLDLADAPELFAGVVKELRLAVQQNATWARLHCRNAIRDIERYSTTNGAYGKAGLSSYDTEVFAWMGIPEPKRQSVLQAAPEQQTVKVEMVAPQAVDGERKPCPRCKEAIKLDATYCRFCNLTLSDSAQPKRTTRTQLTDEPVD